MPAGIDEKVYQPKLEWGLSIGPAPYLSIEIRAPSTVVPVATVRGWPKGQATDLTVYPLTITLKDFGGINTSTRSITLGINIQDTVITETKVVVYVTLEGELVGKEALNLPERSDGPIEASHGVERGLTTVQFAAGPPSVLAHGDEDPFPLRRATRAMVDEGLLTEPPPPSFTVTARLNMMPPGPGRLIVSGEVWATSGGWRFALEPAVNQSLDGKTLVLNLVSYPPQGMAILPMWPTTIDNYVESPPKAVYTEVVVRDGKSEVRTKVIRFD